MWKRRIITFLSFLFLFAVAGTVFAAPTFSLSPAKMELRLGAGESVIRNIYLANKTGQDAVFKIEVEDISAGKTSDQIVEFYGKNAGPYSIKNYVLISDNQIEVKNGKTVVVPVMVTLPYNAMPGGSYGSVLFSLVNNDTESTNAHFSTRIGSLIFLRTKGPILESGDVADFSVSGGRVIYNNKPINFQTVYENLGNIYQNPYGYIEIKNNLTQKKIRIEVSPYFVFPNSTRRKEVSWNNPYFGYYEATLHLNKGYNNQVETRSYDFVALPLNHIVIIILIVIVSGTFYRAYKKIKIKRQNAKNKI